MVPLSPRLCRDAARFGYTYAFGNTLRITQSELLYGAIGFWKPQLSQYAGYSGDDPTAILHGFLYLVPGSWFAAFRLLFHTLFFTNSFLSGFWIY